MESNQVLLDRYRIEREIGRGSFGVVYLASDLKTQQRRAVKVLLPWVRHDQSLRRRLQREAKLTKMLKSPHAVRIHDLGETDTGDLFIVMEYLQGRELDATIKVEGSLPPARVTSILTQALDALGEAHDLGVIHRDLKPHNVFLCDDEGREHVKLIDFGIAKVAGTRRGLQESARLTMHGGVLGTPAYMSPEQCRGEDLTPASDLYSLGILGYQMLTGRVPFEAENPVWTMMKQNHDPLPPLPPRFADTDLGRAITRVLEKDPADRFATAAEFAAALSGRTAPVPVGASSAAASPAPGPSVSNVPSGPPPSAAAPSPAPEPSPQDASPDTDDPSASPAIDRSRYRVDESSRRSRFFGYLIALALLLLFLLVLFTQVL